MRSQDRSQPTTATPDGEASPHTGLPSSLPRAMRSIICGGLIVAISALAGVVGFEIYHRVNLSSRIPERINSAAMWIQNHTLSPSPSDEYLGRKIETHPRGLFKINTTIDVGVARRSARGR